MTDPTFARVPAEEFGTMTVELDESETMIVIREHVAACGSDAIALDVEEARRLRDWLNCALNF